MLAQRQVFLEFKYIVLKNGISLRVRSGDGCQCIPKLRLLSAASMTSPEGNPQEHFFVYGKTGRCIHSVPTV